jgi:hypothetical protein
LRRDKSIWALANILLMHLIRLKIGLCSIKIIG